MGLFDFVPFEPGDVRAVASGTATRSQILSVLTSTTCGEACWHAREEICRCSCGGKNHGCLRSANGEQPVRMAKIDGVPYNLAGVGYELRAEAGRINRAAGYRSVEKPYLADNGGEPFWVQYRYSWSETDPGAPARVKYASKEQIARWPELSAYKDCGNNRPCLLWVRQTMPPRPAQLVIDTKTGLPLEDQNPTR